MAVLQLNISPKAHALAVYLHDQAEEFKGIGDFSKDFVERSHQDSIHEKKCSAAIKGRVHATDLHMNLGEALL